ncbi:transcriptional adapter 2-alpha-like [Clavelina lepadiformis]|uniref:Transcriptional adapter n=1 Tax=Clavelina lepadiformis TaxID=159417 RepID=A0ABP0FL78_CLALP
MEKSDKVERACPGCSSEIAEPYIKCAECGPEAYRICFSCFTKGFESGSHENNHKYEIITNDFPILEHGWSASEELKLLDALADCGSGNWGAIASQVKTKSKLECELHYMKCYVANAKYPLPDMPNPQVRPPSIPIPFKACEDPCRPLPDSHRAQHMAGYLAARGDFIEEYDNYAEWDVQDVYFSPDDRPILKSLKMAVVKIYQSRLNERARRKHIIRKFGLINHSNHLLRYIRKLSPELRSIEVKLRPVMQYQPHPIAHDKMVQGLGLELELREKIKRLKEYRNNGITCFRVAKLYEKLKVKREQSKIKSNCISEILPYLHDPNALAQWLQRQAAIEAGMLSSSSAPSVVPAVRKYAPPIDLTGLPGVEKLTEVERDFCANARLVPEAFLSYKSALINEYRKNGPVRLATARTVVKIDVNKTRKLYDFLGEQGIIEHL